MADNKFLLYDEQIKNNDKFNPNLEFQDNQLITRAAFEDMLDTDNYSWSGEKYQQNQFIYEYEIDNVTEISKTSISNLFESTLASTAYNKATQYYEFTLDKYFGNILTEGTDFSVDGDCEITPGNSSTDYSAIIKISGTNPGDYEVTIHGEGEYDGNVTLVFEINKKSISDAEYSYDTEMYTYNGQAQLPIFTFDFGTDGNGNEWKITSNNITFSQIPTARTNAGSYEGTFVVDSSESQNYIGEKTVSWTIKKANINNYIVNLEWDIHEYNGTEQKPEVSINSLTKGTDYDVVYPNDSTSAETKTITITGKGNYTGETTAEYEIERATPILMLETEDGQEDGTTKYAFKAKVTTPTQIHGNIEFNCDDEDHGPNQSHGVHHDLYTNEEDYEDIHYEQSAGTYYMYAVFYPDDEENYYKSAEVKAVLTITEPDTIDISDYAVYLSMYEYTYNGNEQMPAIMAVKYGNNELDSTDYDVEYPDNAIDAGTKTIKITGKGNYTGTKEVEFVILPKSIADSSIEIRYIISSDGQGNNQYVDEISIEYDGNSHNIWGNLATPFYLIGLFDNTRNVNLKNGQDYSLPTDNVSFTDAGTYYGTISGINNYTDTAEVKFTITKATPILELQANGGKEDGTDYSINVKVTTPTDITGQIQYAYAETDFGYGQQLDLHTTDVFNTNNDYIELENEQSAGTYYIYAIFVPDDDENYYQSDEVRAVLTITEPDKIDIDNCEITLQAHPGGWTYTGNQITPGVIVKYNGTTLTKDDDYTVSYSNNIDAGTATITINATQDSNYTGYKDKTFTINQAESALQTLVIGNGKYDGTGGHLLQFMTVLPEKTNNLPGTIFYGEGNYNNELSIPADTAPHAATACYILNVSDSPKTINIKFVPNDSNYTTIETTYDLTLESRELDGTSFDYNLTGNQSTFTYDGTQKTPGVTVGIKNSTGTTTVTADNYTVEYGENINAGENAGSVTIIGKNNLSGSYTLYFTINKATLSKPVMSDVTKYFSYAMYNSTDGATYPVTNNNSINCNITGSIDVTYEYKPGSGNNTTGETTYNTTYKVNKEINANTTQEIATNDYSVGTYVITIKFTPKDADASNYNESSQTTATLTIDPDVTDIWISDTPSSSFNPSTAIIGSFEIIKGSSMQLYVVGKESGWFSDNDDLDSQYVDVTEEITVTGDKTICTINNNELYGTNTGSSTLHVEYVNDNGDTKSRTSNVTVVDSTPTPQYLFTTIDEQYDGTSPYPIEEITRSMQFILQGTAPTGTTIIDGEEVDVFSALEIDPTDSQIYVYAVMSNNTVVDVTADTVCTNASNINTTQGEIEIYTSTSKTNAGYIKYNYENSGGSWTISPDVFGDIRGAKQPSSSFGIKYNDLSISVNITFDIKS